MGPSLLVPPLLSVRKADVQSEAGHCTSCTQDPGSMALPPHLHPILRVLTHATFSPSVLAVFYIDLVSHVIQAHFNLACESFCSGTSGRTCRVIYLEATRVPVTSMWKERGKLQVPGRRHSLPLLPVMGWTVSLPQIHMLKSKPPGSQNAIVFGDKVFKEVIVLKWSL